MRQKKKSALAEGDFCLIQRRLWRQFKINLQIMSNWLRSFFLVWVVKESTGVTPQIAITQIFPGIKVNSGLINSLQTIRWTRGFLFELFFKALLKICFRWWWKSRVSVFAADKCSCSSLFLHVFTKEGEPVWFRPEFCLSVHRHCFSVVN